MCSNWSVRFEKFIAKKCFRSEIPLPFHNLQIIKNLGKTTSYNSSSVHRSGTKILKTLLPNYGIKYVLAFKFVYLLHCLKVIRLIESVEIHRPRPTTYTYISEYI